tara:strand:+ start:44 stop:574 length:531 start_codon:yes stop_codon:yes gene_type:complete
MTWSDIVHTLQMARLDIDPLLNKIVLIGFIIMGGFIFGKIVEKFIMRFFKELPVNPFLSTLKFSAKRTIAVIVKVFIYVCFFIWAVYITGYLTQTLYVVGIFFIVLVIISLLLWLFDFFPSFIAGFKVRVEGQSNQGQKVIFEGNEYTVKRRNVESIVLHKTPGELLEVPYRTYKD